MKIGIPAGSMAGESRVSLTPSGVAWLILGGHEEYVECGAGIESGYPDEEYEAVGAIVLDQAFDVWNHSDVKVKVKEP